MGFQRFSFLIDLIGYLRWGIRLFTINSIVVNQTLLEMLLHKVRHTVNLGETLPDGVNLTMHVNHLCVSQTVQHDIEYF